MPIDASIYGAVRAPDAINPLQMYGQALQVQGAVQANELNGMKMDEYQRGVADKNRLLSIVQSGGDPAALRRGGFLKEAADWEKNTAEVGHKAAETKKVLTEVQKTKILQHRDLLANVNDPETAAKWLQYGYTDPDTGPVLQGLIPYADAAAKIPTDPQGFQTWKQQAALGATEYVKQNKPTYTTQNLGGTSRIVATPGLGGPSTVATEAPITQSADNRASNARMAADAAASRAQSDRHFNATQSKPFEVTGPDGPVLVQQGRDGKIVPVEGYSPKAGVPKPLAGPVLKQLTEARDNAATIDALNTTFKKEFADKGILGMGADASLAAKGTFGRDKDAVEWWKNYRKQAELVERHALFGAALTPTEQASWRSADIGPGMDADVIARNLTTRANLAKRVFANTQQDLIDAGHNPARINAISGRSSGPTAAPAAPTAAPATPANIQSLVDKYSK